MTPSHANRKGKRYRYYVCTGAQKLGWHTCPMPSVAAPALEQVVLGQIKELVQEAGSVRLLEDPHWQTLALPEQARLVRRLVERVDFDGSAGKLVVAFHADGLERLAEELQENAYAIAQTD